MTHEQVVEFHGHSCPGVAMGYAMTRRALAFLAQWKMSEVAAGIISADLDNEGSFEEDGYPDYNWHIEALPTDTPGLSEVSVTASLDTEQTSREFTLHRLVYRPEEVLELSP